MRIKFYLSFIFLVLIVGYSCKKTKEQDVSSPGVPPPSDTTKPVVTPILNVSRSSIEVGNDTDYTDTFAIQSNIEWELSLSAGADAWLSSEVINRFGEKQIVKITVTSTNTSTSKAATLTISAKNASVLPRQVIIIQKAYSLVWQKCYGGSKGDYFMATVQLPNGQLATNGFSGSSDGDATGNPVNYQMPWTLRVGNDGNRIWQTPAGVSYGGSYYSIVAATDGGTVGTGNIGTSGRLPDIPVTKLDADGNMVWNKTFGGTSYEYAYKIINTADGGYLVSGMTNSQDGDIKVNHGGFDLWVIKLDANGNIVWEKTFGGAGADMYGVVTACSDGGYLLCGQTESNNSGDVPAIRGYDDILVVKMDANGNKLWSKTYGGSSGELPYAVISDPDGGCIVTGYTYSADGDARGHHGKRDVWVFKLSNSGQIIWQATLGGKADDEGQALVRLSNGNIALTGYTESNDGDVTGNHGLSDTWVVLLNKAGKKLWQKTFGSSGYEGGNDIMVAADGSLLITSSTSGNDGDVSGNHGDGDAWLFKLK